MDELVPSDRITKEDVDAAHRKWLQGWDELRVMEKELEKDADAFYELRLAFRRQEMSLTMEQIALLEDVDDQGMWEDYGDSDDIVRLELLQYIVEDEARSSDVRFMVITEAGKEALNRARNP